MLTVPPTANTGLNEFDLLNLDPVTAEAPESRIKDVVSALSIFATLRTADEKSASNRARLDAMFDGAAPYDQRVLVSTGQGSRTNLNFGEAARYLDISMSAFVDLYTSLERLVRVHVRAGEPTQRTEAEDVIAEEATAVHRDWPEAHSSFLRLCNEFTKHGVGVTYFDDAKNWRYRVSGLSDFLLPRQTKASEEAIEVACVRRQYLLHELYAIIRNPAAAAKVGWDVDEIKRVIMTNAKTTGRTGSHTYLDWETTQRELKNNDLYTGIENTSVEVVCMWVREFDGSISYLMFSEETPKTFMFRRDKMFARAEHAFLLFAYGVGTNGTYHSVRGLGGRIFNHVQTSNRLRCQRLDSAMMAGAVMIQPDSQRALADLSFTMYGPYSILSPNVRIVEKVVPNLTQNMDPALADIQSQLQQNVDSVSTYGNQSSPYRNELQTEHDLAVSSRLSGSTLNLFYASFSRLMREFVRRLVTGDKSDPAVRDFYARCAERGVGEETIKSIDHSKTSAVKAIGAGSAANRLLALRELRGIAGDFDETGRRNLTRDITSERVGRDLVDRYAPPNPAPRQGLDTKMAMLENQQMQAGFGIPVLDSEMHGDHLRIHLPVFGEMLAAIDSGTADPVQLLPVVQLFHQQISDHTQYLAGSPAAAAEVAAAKQALQMGDEVITNTGRKIQAMQRKQVQATEDPATGPAAEAPAGPTQAEMKLQEHQLKMQIAEEKAQLDMRIKDAKAQQELALKDVARAADLTGTVTNR